jgi:hypothetical protein
MFAYQPRNPTETTLHHVITHTEDAVENKKVTFGAFLDIKGTSDSTSLHMI